MLTWFRSCVRWALAVPLFAPWVACRGASYDASAASWVNLKGGGEFGRRVRAHEVEGFTHHVFHSTALGRDVGLVVATPPEYAQRASARYPVVYMFPGIQGDEWAYPLPGERAAPVLKFLFSDPGTAPIVVFTNPGSSGGYGAAERVLSEELIAFVDQNYRTRPDPRARSLEGFSLGGVTALTLLLQRPDVFGRAVGASSACYLLTNCDAIRKQLAARAKAALASQVLLSIGGKESEKNAAVNYELAHLLGTRVIELPEVDHDWGAQLATPVGGRLFGALLADFHRAGFSLQ